MTYATYETWNCDEEEGKLLQHTGNYLDQKYNLNYHMNIFAF